MSYMIVHKERNKLQVDGWTYGDWRQYVAFFPNDTARCVKIAEMPAILAMIGFVLLTLPAMAAFMAFNGVPVNWPNVIKTTAVGLVLPLPWAVTWFTKWRLVVPVSKVMKADENGCYDRSF